MPKTMINTPALRVYLLLVSSSSPSVCSLAKVFLSNCYRLHH